MPHTHFPDDATNPDVVDQHGLEHLDRETCFHLLRSVPIARMGVTMDALPVILPVNFVLTSGHLDDEPVVIVRSGRGTKLSAAAAGSVVAIEADHYDAFEHAGWSVLVQGMSRIVESPDEHEWAAHLPLRPWAIPDAECFIAVTTRNVSGRRFGAR